MKEADIRDRIEGIACEYPRYGYRRITKQLHREGFVVNHKKVLRIMRESSLLCSVKRKWIKTTDSRHQYRRYPNLIKDRVARGTKPDLGSRYYLYPYNDSICLPCSDSRYFFSKGCWLCHMEEFGPKIEIES